MPVYEYVCAKCGAKSEFVESLGMGRIAARKCGACGSSRLKKVASSFTYHKEVTLEDLGVKVNYRQAAPGMGSGMEAPQGPPPGGCPYCQPEAAEEPAGPPGQKPGGMPDGKK